MKVKSQTARADIYETGIRIEDETTKRGYRRDRSKPANENDRVIVPKGSKYYTWQFKNSPVSISLTYPKPAQLTRSSFLQEFYGIQDTITDFEASDADGIESGIQEIVEQLESLKDTTQESLDAMPEHLQESSSSGQLLQERIDGLEEMISELEGIDADYDEKELDDWISDENLDDLDEYGNPWMEENEDFISWKEEQEQDWINEKVEEVQNINIPF
jgi:hypothetical protein